MGAHQSYAIDEPGGVNAYSQHTDLDALSGNGMGGVRATFSSKETSEGLFGPHFSSSFVKDVEAFTKAFKSSMGDPPKLIADFVKKMKNDYGINATVK